MPVDMSKYPDNWQEIRERILRRAGGNTADPRVGSCCEWCGLRNYSVGYRDSSGVFAIRNDCNSYAEAKEKQGDWHNYNIAHDDDSKPVIIVLTIAHLDDPDPMNCDDDNLAALCQRCHNNYDSKMRKTNAAKTSRQQRIEAGQMALELANETV